MTGEARGGSGGATSPASPGLAGHLITPCDPTPNCQTPERRRRKAPLHAGRNCDETTLGLTNFFSLTEKDEAFFWFPNIGVTFPLKVVCRRVCGRVVEGAGDVEVEARAAS